MAKALTADNIAANLTPSERSLLFCVAARFHWVSANTTDANAQTLMTLGLIEEDDAGSYLVTEQGRAVLSGMLASRN